MEIKDEHVEWAVINRLKAMLDHPPKTKFNITQTFSTFSTILLWSKSRAWVGGNNPPAAWVDPVDHRAHAVKLQLQNERIVDPPWLLSMREPALVSVKQDGCVPLAAVNTDFQDMSAEQFVKWLRDAFGHGDGRTIRPLHRHSSADKTWLIGLRIEFEKTKGSANTLCLHLYEADMRRIGSRLADIFCASLSDGDGYSEKEVGTKNGVREAQPVA